MSLKLPCMLIVAFAVFPLVVSIPLLQANRYFLPLGVTQFSTLASRVGTKEDVSLSNIG